jgi:hypothetical protein
MPVRRVQVLRRFVCLWEVGGRARGRNAESFSFDLLVETSKFADHDFGPAPIDFRFADQASYLLACLCFVEMIEVKFIFDPTFAIHERERRAATARVASVPIVLNNDPFAHFDLFAFRFLGIFTSRTIKPHPCGQSVGAIDDGTLHPLSGTRARAVLPHVAHRMFAFISILVSSS